MKRNHPDRIFRWTGRAGVFKKMTVLALTAISAVSLAFPVSAWASGGGNESSGSAISTDQKNTGKTVTLRVCSWEEYIDTGDWDKSDAIDLPEGTILAKNSMVKDFEDWYQKTYGVKVRVEYSTFGTNEDLYNRLTLGDVYDLVCPSEYMVMKLMAEHQLTPLSKEFFDRKNTDNYYIRGVSPYIQGVFEKEKTNGEAWARYMAGYMWGITGFVYNPSRVTEKEASTWKLLDNPKFRRQITIKDNVRDAYFAAVGALKSPLLTSKSFLESPDYSERLQKEMNDTSDGTIRRVQDYLQDVRNNVYSFETDSGKADMITGKVLANYQWSGDAVYTMNQADEDNYRLDFAVPKESTNIYFDGWCMLKKGIGHDREKQRAAEAWINFLSRPDNAIRNMSFIGYTSAISGGEDPRIFDYLKWQYEKNENLKGLSAKEKKTVPYDVNYFFSKSGKGDYVLNVPEIATHRQLSAQYPSTQTIQRSSIMNYFNPDQSRRINRMWVNVRCFNLMKMPVWGWVLTIAALAGLVWLIVFRVRQKVTNRDA